MNDIGEDGASIVKTQELKEEIEELKKLNEKIQIQNNKTKDKNTKLQDKVQENEDKIAELEEELSELRDGGTPRPDWQRCASVVEGGNERWKKALKGKTSEQLMGLLLDDISQLRRSNREWLEGRGKGIRVPIYLRFEGQVKNMNIDIKMVCDIIADLLNSKEERQVAISMPEYLYQYVNLKYSTETLQMEFSYNLVDGLERFKEIPHINFFKEVLEQNLSEDILARILDTVHRVQMTAYTKLEKINKTRSPQKDYLSEKDFLEILKQRFLSKDQCNIEQLLNLAYKESKDEFDDPDNYSRKIYVYRLFTGIKDWNFGLFIQEIFKQEQAEKDDLIRKFMDNLDDELTNINSKSVKEALKELDQSIPIDRQDSITQIIFDNNLSKTLNRKEMKKKLNFIDIVGSFI